jgi:hypothetical protein
VNFRLVALALGAAKSKRIDAPQIAFPRADAVLVHKRPMQAVLASDTQRQMGLPDVVKVSRWRRHLRLAPNCSAITSEVMRTK